MIELLDIRDQGNQLVVLILPAKSHKIRIINWNRYFSDLRSTYWRAFVPTLSERNHLPKVRTLQSLRTKLTGLYNNTSNAYTICDELKPRLVEEQWPKCQIGESHSWKLRLFQDHPSQKPWRQGGPWNDMHFQNTIFTGWTKGGCHWKSFHWSGA